MNSIKFLSKIALTAGILLALALTFSCSDDNKGSWLTCQEVASLEDSCESKYSAEYDACKYDEACEHSVNAKMDKCFMDGACNGTSKKECLSHYRACDEDDDD